jgi:hypothetical protein
VKQPLIKLLASILFCLTFCNISAFARIVSSDWDYEKLTAQADLVAIIEPLENQTTNDIFPSYTYGHSTNDFQAVNTRFKVNAILKMTGGSLNPNPQELTVLHFCYSTNKVLIIDGAEFANFPIGPLHYDEKISDKDGKFITGFIIIQKPVWLAFLKLRKDGRYEPVTDQYDSLFSFRFLHRPE